MATPQRRTRGAQEGGELDPEALAAARRGEPWAQRAFVRHFQAPVHRLCWRILDPAGRTTIAEDVAQDALVRIVRALPGFDEAGPATLQTWVLRIATRAAIDELRRRPLPVTPIDDEVVPADDRADLVAERRLIAKAIASAIESLAPEFRAAFVLRAYHDLDYDEIARALDVEVGTVKSRLSRARAVLRERLTEVRRG